jgi:hypothetical protein
MMLRPATIAADLASPEPQWRIGLARVEGELRERHAELAR